VLQHIIVITCGVYEYAGFVLSKDEKKKTFKSNCSAYFYSITGR
jgi:hypothetical protein